MTKSSIVTERHQMASVTGLTIVKSFLYRADATEEYSNQYWLSGTPPTTDAAWLTLADAVVAKERTVYHSAVTVVRAYGYNSDADDAVAVWAHDYVLAGTPPTGNLTGLNAFVCPGDVAAWVRWKTSRLNSKGKPIYLRKYFHPAFNAGSTSALADQLHATYRAALMAFGLGMYDGSLPDARFLRSRLHAEGHAGHGASAYVTTRTLKRRGKRPNS